MGRATKYLVKCLLLFIIFDLPTSSCNDYRRSFQTKRINDSICVEARKYAESYENEASEALANNDIASHASYKAMSVKVLETCN